MNRANQPAAAMPGQPQTHPAATLLPALATKIRATHREKLAMVYVRQSSPQQVLENRESSARQYALGDTAVALGWPRERVVIIDEDQGQSGRSAAGRLGFQRLLAELTLDHVGLILSLEMSRLARSDKDWHHLLELCGVFGTLLADQDGIYDAADPNDRLLLGLKGAMSSLELQTMRNRLDKGKLCKARRGELFCGVPMGYVRLPGGGVDVDPDEQARAVVRMIFEKFEELGSVHALFGWLVRNRVALPIRVRSGSRAGQLEWRRPVCSTLAQMLHHPLYAGAYAYGRRPADAKRHYATGKRHSRGWVPMEQWQVLIRDHLPAYISWERYLGNLERMRQNRTTGDTAGAPRAGCALLGGLVVCGRCDWRMQVSYQARDKAHYYCRRHFSEASAPCGCGVSAASLEEAVAGQVLRALEPAALELSLQAQGDVRTERERLERHWRQTLQRTRYEAEAAERRYRAVDAENRLVAVTLERQWEAALRRQREAQEGYDRFARQALPKLSLADETRIAALASDIAALWRCARTTNRDRQAVLRCLVTRVVVHVEQGSAHASATIHWAGGHQSRVAFVRPVRSYAELRDNALLKQRVVKLREEGRSAAEIAAALNEEGRSPIKPGERFTADVVRGLFRTLGIRGEIGDDLLLGPDEWWLHDLANAVSVRWGLLRVWATRGWVHARQTKVQGLWILWADRDEVRRLRQLQSLVYAGRNSFPEDLTTPKQRTPEE
jgi:DNA invertase Pin-like site-specific DNA recombinase